MGIKKIKRQVVKGVAEVLSYPKRTLYDAKAASSNALADSYLAKKARLKAAKQTIGNYKPTKLR